MNLTLPRILIIDDDEQVARSLAAALQRQSVTTLLTSSVEACRILTSPAGADYDLIFCDLSMPWIDGIELHRRVQAVDATVAERFVFLTGDIGPHVDALVAAGAEVLAKPFEVAQVRALIPTSARIAVAG